jgi:hypothetical protein
MEYLSHIGYITLSDSVVNITLEGVIDTESETSTFRTQVYDPPIMITVDMIDTFKKVKSVSIDEVKDLIPISLSEDAIQYHIEQIIGEPDHKNDWGGETNDLFTTHLIHNGKRIATAFLLKGPGQSGELTISKCGKNGDQILRLFDSPASLFIIQHIDKISEGVIKDAQLKVHNARQNGNLAFFAH